MYLKKRAQVTVFIILGVTILVVFLFINKASNDVQKIKLENQADDIKSSVEQSQAIQYYIKLCLKDSAEESLLLLGKQGGRIWDYQGGKSRISDFPHHWLTVGDDSLNVSYGITEAQLNPPFIDSWFFNAPWYPETEARYAFIDKSNGYYFGDDNLPQLCDKNGPNAFNQTKPHYSGVSCTPTDPPYDINGEKYMGNGSSTIQIQLADYTSRLLEKCTDPKIMKGFSGYNFTFEHPNTTVTLGEDNIIFNVNFPIDIKLQNDNLLFNREIVITKEIYFSTTVPVRLKRIYDFSRSIIDDDIRNITFLMPESYQSKESYRRLTNKSERVTLDIVQVNDLPMGLVMVTDYNSLIAGEPYTFQFLRANRPPLLDWIHNYSGQHYDIIVPELKTITITPKGYDPDESYYNPTNCNGGNDKCMNENYTYSGWKETEDYYFDYECCTDLYSSDTESCLSHCVTKYPFVAPHNWTNSLLFQSNGRDAVYTTKKEDVGNHTLNISVCDEHGVCDWQIVNIMVYDLPKPIAQGSNSFDDINDSYASDEDPYILDAKASFIIGPPGGTVLRYKWCDDVEFPDCFTFLDALVTLPSTSFTIENITEAGINFFDYGQNDFNPPGYILHRINLTIPPDTLKADELSVAVYQCLPHRSNSPSYPYNNFSGDNYENTADPFQANHTCCTGNGKSPNSVDWGKPALSSSTCYSLTEYGSYKSFTVEYLSQLYQLNMTEFSWLADIIFPAGLSLNTYTPTNYLSFANTNFQNDVFKRTVTRNCDGTRGNVCSGALKDEITNISCSDKTFGTGRRCSGPNASIFLLTSQNAKSCINYTGDTFEHAFGLAPGDSARTCSDLTRCSTETTYNTSGHYLAKGTCDSIGGCKGAYATSDCFNVNTCVGNNNNLYIKQKISGTNYTGCQNNPSDAICKTNSYELWDYCVGNDLYQPKCQVNPKSFDDPYYYEAFTCAQDTASHSGLAACAETSPGSGLWQSRTSSACSNGACINPDTLSWSSCGNYACDLNGCKTECSSNSDCTSETICDFTYKKCVKATDIIVAPYCNPSMVCANGCTPSTSGGTCNSVTPTPYCDSYHNNPTNCPGGCTPSISGGTCNSCCPSGKTCAPGSCTPLVASLSASYSITRTEQQGEYTYYYFTSTLKSNNAVGITINKRQKCGNWGCDPIKYNDVATFYGTDYISPNGMIQNPTNYFFSSYHPESMTETFWGTDQNGNGVTASYTIKVD